EESGYRSPQLVRGVGDELSLRTCGPAQHFEEQIQRIDQRSYFRGNCCSVEWAQFTRGSRFDLTPYCNQRFQAKMHADPDDQQCDVNLDEIDEPGTGKNEVTGPRTRIV